MWGLQVRQRHISRTSYRRAVRLRLEALQCWGHAVREQQLLRRRCAKRVLAHFNGQANRILHGWQVKSCDKSDSKTYIHTIQVMGFFDLMR